MLWEIVYSRQIEDCGYASIGIKRNRTGEDYMILREYLTEFTKEELLDQARSFALRKCSGLRKAELIDKIVMNFCSEEMVRSRLACLTKEQMDLYRKACSSPTVVSVNEIIDAMQLHRYWLGYFEDPTDNFCVFEDVAEAFHQIDDEAFRVDNYKKGWLTKCIHFFITYYGIAPIEVVYNIFKQKIKCSIDEMIEMFGEIPMDIFESAIFSMDMLGMSDWPKNSPLYSEKGLLVHIPLFTDDELGYLLKQQMNKDFYIPSVKSLDEIYRAGYEASSLAYKKLETFLMQNIGLPYKHAVSWCLQIWANSYEGDSPTDVINRMTEAKINFNSKKDMEDFIGLLMNAHNSTRLKENRGHRPEELSRNIFAGGMPTVVPASSNAAALLKDAAPQLQAMGIPIDLNGSADTIHTSVFPNGLNGEMLRAEKKIYPNDPCFCGSGKKYKKCCGKNK